MILGRVKERRLNSGVKQLTRVLEDPQVTVSADLRDMRKQIYELATKNGNFNKKKRRSGRKGILPTQKTSSTTTASQTIQNIAPQRRKLLCKSVYYHQNTFKVRLVLIDFIISMDRL
jgi:signal transduction histidine kinase